MMGCKKCCDSDIVFFRRAKLANIMDASIESRRDVIGKRKVNIQRLMCFCLFRNDIFPLPKIINLDPLF